MGLLVDGKWQDRWYDTADTGGRFVRTEAQFRNWITADGTPGPTGEGGFVAEPGRYHLYVSLACPWAHRTLIFRKLKGLDKAITVSVVHWLMGEQGWTFAQGPDCTGDPVNDADYLHQIYTLAKPGYTGRVTVPMLWDKQRQHDRQQRVRPTSSACSTRPSTASAPCRATTIRPTSGPRSTR